MPFFPKNLIKMFDLGKKLKLLLILNRGRTDGELYYSSFTEESDANNRRV